MPWTMTAARAGKQGVPAGAVCAAVEVVVIDRGRHPELLRLEVAAPLISSASCMMMSSIGRCLDQLAVDKDVDGVLVDPGVLVAHRGCGPD